MFSRVTRWPGWVAPINPVLALNVIGLYMGWG